jgi:hypothetical protein
LAFKAFKAFKAFLAIDWFLGLTVNRRSKGAGI